MRPKSSRPRTGPSGAPLADAEKRDPSIRWLARIGHFAEYTRTRARAVCAIAHWECAIGGRRCEGRPGLCSTGRTSGDFQGTMQTRRWQRRQRLRVTADLKERTHGSTRAPLVRPTGVQGSRSNVAAWPRVHRVGGRARTDARCLWRVDPSTTGSGVNDRERKKFSNGSKPRSRCNRKWCSRVQNVAIRQSIVFRAVDPRLRSMR